MTRNDDGQEGKDTQFDDDPAEPRGELNRYTAALGPRALKTRRRLIDSAAELFRERGYVATTVSDIARKAGVSLATFYVYFAERSDVVIALLDEVVGDVMRQGVGKWDPRSGRAGLSRVVSSYVESFAKHAEFFAIRESVIHAEERMLEQYVQYNRHFQDTFARYLEEGVALGLVRSDLDSHGMARAMTLMMERYCYDVFVLGSSGDTPSVTDVAHLLATLWADAIDLAESAVRPRVTAAGRPLK
ncbi:TetR/AcrR family transcriptional regulator [Pseudonocardia sp.]|jgi:AcrR family transcriptional regulator|uniref:TetR/AcrR family transcriptional regulator n=1 Tax=Pseudonocardia sp. TaxID=60912 RepID=UPI003D0D7FDA